MEIKKRAKTLRQAGIDPERYLSMRIDKNQIPDGVEVVITIRDRETGELREVPVNTAMEARFGKNSMFYRQAMADGNIFNPYIHRRWLPAQFRRNVRYAGYSGIAEYVRESYHWNYVIRFLREECAKLAMLEKRDREAFEERKVFFIPAGIGLILTEYVRQVCDILDQEYEKVKNVRSRGGRPVYISAKGIGCVQREHVQPMKHRFNVFCESVQRCRGYAQLSELMQSFDFAKLDGRIPSNDSFAKRFIEAGAYYTLKQMIMFEGLSLGGNDVVENLRIMKERGKCGYMALYQSEQEWSTTERPH